MTRGLAPGPRRVPAFPSELVASILVTITETLGLEECGDPYMTLCRASQGNRRFGAVRVWQPSPFGPRRNVGVEKLVYMHLRTPAMTAQWVFAFSGANSLVPHFIFGLTGSSRDSSALGLHCDLVSKIPRASQTAAYASVCYAPLAATQRALVERLGQSLQLLHEGHAEVMSERLLFFRLDAAHPALPQVAEARSLRSSLPCTSSRRFNLRRTRLRRRPRPQRWPPRRAAHRSRRFPAASLAAGASSSPTAAATSPSAPACRGAAAHQHPLPTPTLGSVGRQTSSLSDVQLASLRHFAENAAREQLLASKPFFDGSAELLDSLDRSVRSRLFSASSDPLWPYLHRLLGPQIATAFHGILVDSTELIADYPSQRSSLRASAELSSGWSPSPCSQKSIAEEADGDGDGDGGGRRRAVRPSSTPSSKSSKSNSVAAAPPSGSQPSSSRRRSLFFDTTASCAASLARARRAHGATDGGGAGGAGAAAAAEEARMVQRVARAKTSRRLDPSATSLNSLPDLHHARSLQRLVTPETPAAASGAAASGVAAASPAAAASVTPAGRCST